MDNVSKHNNYSEEELVEMAKNGNEEAGEYLIRKYKKVVKTKAHLYFMVGADRDDVVQEGMIGIFKAIKSFDDTKETSFRTFAELCINRQIITAIKQATRMKHSPLNTSVSLSKPITEDSRSVTLAETISSDSNSDPEALFIMKEMLSYIEGNGPSAFSDLEYRVWNQYLKGKSYREISEALGKSQKSIDNAIQRTKRKLANYIIDAK
ncbi:MAG: RNA polymerase sporulation sigma factor SigH [Anaerovoracaceae bacterium]|jgi:RNA polymerase sporulation-specific sigma factor